MDRDFKYFRKIKNGKIRDWSETYLQLAVYFSKI